MNRIKEHMILSAPKDRRKAHFFFGGKKMSAYEGEAVSSALFANGIKIFGLHPKDKSPQGIFCANGQCAQCALIIDGVLQKSCVTKLKEGMRLEPIKEIPEARNKISPIEFGEMEEPEFEVLIIGGGPGGLSAAQELGKLNISTLIADDKHKLGGKLVLQTHKFFGSVEDCYAGTRGIDIADKLSDELNAYPSIKIWTEATCIGVFSDKKVGIAKDGKYFLVRPKSIIVAAGAREKFLPFRGNTLPGVYGAGAFQTLVNRDLIKPSKRLFILGGGNVGLIAAYHALQANIKVIGLAEAMPEVGGYKVHADKIKRLGVPIYASHTVIEAAGKEKLESVTIAEIDENFKETGNSRKTFKADTLLVAVGLNSANEFYHQAKNAEMPVVSCGDAQEIAEASAAMFSGKIAAHKTLKSLAVMTKEVPEFWEEKLKVLKSRPGKTMFLKKGRRGKIYPVIHCFQEIPCNPCVTICPKKSIKLSGDSIMSLPVFDGECVGCMKCLVICPGLAITIVDRRKDAARPFVYIPFEISRDILKAEGEVDAVDYEGNGLGKAKIVKIINHKAESLLILKLEADFKIADKIASVRLFSQENPLKNSEKDILKDAAIVCRCERVAASEIRKAFREGAKDFNQLKAKTRAGMGACQGKSCHSIIKAIAKSEGADLKETAGFTDRPPFIEIPLGQFANLSLKKGGEKNWSDF